MESLAAPPQAPVAAAGARVVTVMKSNLVWKKKQESLLVLNQG